MTEHTTPEERLLKLIRKKNPHSSGEDKQDPAKPKKSASISAGAVPRNFFGVLNKIFAVACVLLVGYVGYQFVFVNHPAQTEFSESKTENSGDSMKEITKELPEAKPFDYYTAPIEARDIFETPFSTAKKVPEAQPATNVPELAKNLKLVGIILDGNSQAVVEDLEAKQTYFLHKGEGVRGAVVDEIQESKVILLYRDQRVELIQ